MTDLKRACSSYPTNLFDFLVETESFSETLSRHSRSNFSQVLRELGTDADDAEIQSLFDVSGRTQAMSKASNGKEVKGNMEHKTKGKKKDQSPGAQAKNRRRATTEGPSEPRKALDFNWNLRKKEPPPFSRNRRSGAYARSYLDRSRVFNEEGNAGPLGSLGLTRRETEVLTWITQGKTNYKIGMILNISPRTICKHVQRILNKLKVENRTAAAAIAIGTLADAPRGVLDMLRGSMGSPSIPGRVAANANHPRPRTTGHGSPITDHSPRAGFTLLELLIVVGIIGLLLVLIAPAFTYIKGGNDVTSAAYTIKGVLDTAHTYAKANNTYTWVGFYEENVENAASPNSDTLRVGRLIMSIVASKDGTMLHTISLSSAFTLDASPNQTALVQVGKLVKIDNMHLMTFAAPTSTPPPLDAFNTRPAPASTAQIGDTTPATPYLTFHYPAGSLSPQYTFTKVIQFSPHGEGVVDDPTYFASGATLAPISEIGVEPTHGAAVPASTPANVVAIQFTGLGGDVKIYRQ